VFHATLFSKVVTTAQFVLRLLLKIVMITLLVVINAISGSMPYVMESMRMNFKRCKLVTNNIFAQLVENNINHE
jgi:hypothetical protein